MSRVQEAMGGGPRPSAASRGGWRIVARKEFADHLSSARFAILVLILGLSGLAAVNSASSEIREVAGEATGAPSIFLFLFTVAPDRIPSYFSLVGFIGPLLGIAFGFDAINSERSQGTLPRLVSQPIHRDDVITGKFVAGLGTISLAIVVLTSVVAGFGLFRIAVVPSSGDLVRLFSYVLLSIIYVGFWLALAIMLSVVVRRAATSVLAGMAAWLVLTLFSGLIFGAIAQAIRPAPDTTDTALETEELLANARLELALQRISPTELYNESSQMILNPQLRSTGIVLSNQLDRAIPDPLSVEQSLLLVWPQVTAIVAGTVVVFTIAFVSFMRQEVRA